MPSQWFSGLCKRGIIKKPKLWLSSFWLHPPPPSYQRSPLFSRLFSLSLLCVAGRDSLPPRDANGSIKTTKRRGIFQYPSTLQMKGRWESNINVWFPCMYSQKWNCYLQNRILMFCLPVPTLIYLWEIYTLSGLVCLFCCMEICVPILGIYKSLTDTWMLTLGLRPRYSQKRNT